MFVSILKHNIKSHCLGASGFEKCHQSSVFIFSNCQHRIFALRIEIIERRLVNFYNHDIIRRSKFWFINKILNFRAGCCTICEKIIDRCDKISPQKSVRPEKNRQRNCNNKKNVLDVCKNFHIMSISYFFRLCKKQQFFFLLGNLLFVARFLDFLRSLFLSLEFSQLVMWQHRIRVELLGRFWIKFCRQGIGRILMEP